MKNLMAGLLGSNKNIAGLDIGTSYVKFMEVEGKSIDSFKVVHYAIEPIPKTLVGENGKFEDMDAVAEIVRKCWKKSGSSVKNVAVAISGNSTTYKKVILPMVDSMADMQLQAENEIIKYLPDGVASNDIALDYYTLGQNVQNPTENDVLLVASKKEKIDERIALVEAAGLIPAVLDVEQYAVQNLLRMMKDDEFNNGTYVVLDCSAYVMKMIVFKNGELIYVKDNNFGGGDLTRDIAISSGMNFEEAENLKLSRAGDDTVDVIEKQFLENYASQFSGVLSYFTSATSINEIKEIVLIGGMAGMPGLPEAIKNVLQDSDVILDNAPYVAKPLESVEKNSKISLNKFHRDEAGLFLVTSLALRKFLRAY